MATPGCVLRVSGSELNPELVLQRISLNAVSIWHRGEKRRILCIDAGFVVVVSEKDRVFDEQVEDAVNFLNSRRPALRDLSSDSTIGDLRLDFGIALCDAAVQSNTFPVELVQLAAEFKIALELSQYPPS